MADGKTVLIADDDEAILTVYSMALERRGHTVLCAKNGNDALVQLESAKVDIVFLDVLMPGKEGLETLLDIRGRYPALPVYIFSGAPTKLDDFVVAADLLRATGIIYKPAPPSALIKLIEAQSD